MSTEMLRLAAKTARDEWAGETTGPFKDAARIHLAVADWLDFIAPFARFGDDDSLHAKHAVIVARAYLGESS